MNQTGRKVARKHRVTAQKQQAKKDYAHAHPSKAVVKSPTQAK